MSKRIINITDKLNNEKPEIVIGDKVYPVNNTMKAVLAFQELVSDSTMDNMKKAISVSLGEKAAKDLNVESMTIENFKVISTAIMAAMQGEDYDTVAERFQKFEKQM